MALRRLIFLIAMVVGAGAAMGQSTEADLAMTKDGPSIVSAGSNAAYTVSVTNLGPDAAVAVTLTDAIPGGMTFVSATQNSGPAFACATPAVGGGGTITCTAATLSAGQSAQFTFVFNINSETAPGTFFTNIASATSTTPDPNEENNSGVTTTSTPPPPAADFGVTKTGPQAAGADTDVVFSISVFNGGPDPADVTLQDVIPGNLTFVSLAQTSGPVLSCTTPAIGAGGVIVCTASGFPAGAAATLTLTLHVPAGTSSGAEYSNSVTVSSSNDPNSENDSALTTMVISQVDVAMTKSGPASVNAGANITYVLTLANAGPDVAVNASMTDTLPAGTTFVSLVQGSGPAAICSTPPAGSAGLVTCSIANLGFGASAQFTLVVRADGTAAVVTNVAAASSDSFDSNGSNDSASVTTTVTPVADVSVAKSGPVTASAGTDLTYTVVVTNAGPSAASSVTFTDLLPPTTTFVSAAQTGGQAFSCTVPAVGVTGTITCTLGSLDPGLASFSIVVRTTSSATGPVTNTAAVAATTSDPDPADNTSVVVTTLTAAADLAVVKTGPAAVVVGSDITYTITVSNAGPSDASGITLTDVLPATATFVSLTQTSGPAFTCTVPSVGSTGTVTCTIPTFTPGSASFSMVIRTSVASAATLSNTATVSGASADPNPANNSSTATTIVGATADLSIVKSGPADVVSGDEMTYAISVANAGPSDASNVVVSDALAAGLTFVGLSQTGGPAFTCVTPPSGSGGTVTCTAASFGASGTAQFSLVVRVALLASGSISNTATISAATPDANPGNGTSTVSTAITPSASIPALSPLALLLLAVTTALTGAIVLRGR